MDEAALREKIGALLLEARRAPPGGDDGRSALPDRAIDLPSALRRDMAALEDGLDHLRLAIKYLVFDLEATKRENRLLRAMLD